MLRLQNVLPLDRDPAHSLPPPQLDSATQDALRRAFAAFDGHFRFGQITDDTQLAREVVWAAVTSLSAPDSAVHVIDTQVPPHGFSRDLIFDVDVILVPRHSTKAALNLNAALTYLRLAFLSLSLSVSPIGSPPSLGAMQWSAAVRPRVWRSRNCSKVHA